jgi:geranylgeranyl pyrophosphate synthase
MVNYIELLGAAFQIQDDLIAVVSQDYAKERGLVGEDIHEGKRTLMVLNSFWSDKISKAKKERLV